MSKRLTEEEKLEHQKWRDERVNTKVLDEPIDKYGAKILRILREEAPLCPNIKYNSKYFEQRLKVTNITILRAIRKLKDHNLLKEKMENGSYVIDENFYEGFYTTHTSEQIKKNVSLIASLGGVLQQYKNTPLYESVKDLIYFLQPEVAKSDKIFASNRVIVPPKMEYNINTQNWEKVYSALQKNHKLRFRYTKSYTNNEAQRIVWPFQLILDNGSVYLFAYSEYADLVLLYDLNYMTEIIVLNEEFELPEKYDINNYSGGGRLGAYKGDKIEKYKIRFTGYAQEWMENHKLADDQSYKAEKDAAIVSFTSSQFDRVLELILSWGCQAEPLAPARLVKRWKEEVLAMAEKIREH